MSLSISQEHDEDDNPFRNESPFRGPLREILIDEIYQGRDFLRYYQYAFLGTLLLVIIFHWINKLYWLLRRKEEISKESDDDYERESLLGRDTVRRPRRVSYYRKIASFLMIQPQGKGVENYGISLVIIIYEIITIFFTIYQIKHWIVLGFRVGLLLTANIPLMYMLGAKHSPLSFLTGWSYEQINVFHRLVGAVCFVLVVVHIAIFIYYFRADYLFTHLWSIAGIIAGSAFVLIGLTSSLKVRERFYESFYIIHIIGFLVSIPAIYLHFPTARPYAVAAGISVLYDRTMRLFDYRIKKCYVSSASGDTIIMRVPYESKGAAFLQRSFEWKTGQHVYITIIGCGTFESHPYTVGSSMDFSNHLKLIIRAREGFSRRLLEHAKREEAANSSSNTQMGISRWCILHGPYGVHPPEMPSSSIAPKRNTKIILIAGGAGVAFTYPLYQEYNKLKQMSDKLDINFLWVIPNRAFIEWIIDEEGEIDETKMDIWATKEKGRPNIDSIINDYIYNSDEGFSSSEDCWVGACGPDPLLREVRNSVANLRSQGMTNVHYYAERFGW